MPQGASTKWEEKDYLELKQPLMGPRLTRAHKSMQSWVIVKHTPYNVIQSNILSLGMVVL